MGSKIEYVDSSQIYATSYVRNSKAIGVLWAIFTICYAIIGVVSFVTPEWIGNISGENPGKFGLWNTCYADEQCKGKLEEILSISNVPYMAATICVGLAVLTALLTIFTMLFFCFCQTTTVFHICAWLQLISGKKNIRSLIENGNPRVFPKQLFRRNSSNSSIEWFHGCIQGNVVYSYKVEGIRKKILE